MAIAFLHGKSFYFLKRTGVTVDYTKLRETLVGQYNCQEIRYYAVIPSGYHESRSLHSLLTFLRNQEQYIIYAARARSERDTVSMVPKMAIDAMEIANEGMDHAIIGATGVEFSPIVQGLQKQGVYVTLATVGSKVDNRLYPLANDYIDLQMFNRYK